MALSKADLKAQTSAFPVSANKVNVNEWDLQLSSVVSAKTSPKISNFWKDLKVLDWSSQKNELISVFTNNLQWPPTCAEWQLVCSYESLNALKWQNDEVATLPSSTCVTFDKVLAQDEEPPEIVQPLACAGYDAGRSLAGAAPQSSEDVPAGPRQQTSTNGAIISYMVARQRYERGEESLEQLLARESVVQGELQKVQEQQEASDTEEETLLRAKLLTETLENVRAARAALECKQQQKLKELESNPLHVPLDPTKIEGETIPKSCHTLHRFRDLSKKLKHLQWSLDKNRKILAFKERMVNINACSKKRHRLKLLKSQIAMQEIKLALFQDLHSKSQHNPIKKYLSLVQHRLQSNSICNPTDEVPCHGMVEKQVEVLEKKTTAGTR